MYAAFVKILKFTNAKKKLCYFTGYVRYIYVPLMSLVLPMEPDDDTNDNSDRTIDDIDTEKDPVIESQTHAFWR